MGGGAGGGMLVVYGDKGEPGELQESEEGGEEEETHC